MAVARQARPCGPHAFAVTVSYPGRSGSVLLVASAPPCVVRAVPFQATRRSWTSATRQRTPARACSISNSTSISSPSALSLSFAVALPLQVAATRTSGRPSLPSRARPGGAATNREAASTAPIVAAIRVGGRADLMRQVCFACEKGATGLRSYCMRLPRTPWRSTQRIAWTRSVTPIWRKMLVRWDFTVFSLIPRRPRDQLVRHPVEEQGEHLALARRDAGERVGRGLRLEQRARGARVERRAALGRGCGCRARPRPPRRPSAGSRRRRRRARP